MRTLALTLAAVLAISAASTFQLEAQQDQQLTGIAACNRALNLLREGQPAEARDLLLAAQATMPAEDEWLWWGNLGHCYRDLRQYEKALEHYAKAVEHKEDCWFRFSWCRTLHEFGRYEEALEGLEGPLDEEYHDRAERLRAVIHGPWRERWPNAWPKLEARSPLGNFLVVSDAGVTHDEMDALEERIAGMDQTRRANVRRIEQMLRPSADLQGLANLADLMWREFVSFTNLRERDMPRGRVSKLFLFTQREDFDAFASKAGRYETTDGLAGYYDPNMKFLSLFNREVGQATICGMTEETIRTFFHEGWHQFFDMLTSQTPIWVDEGLATFVEYCSVSPNGQRIELGLLVKHDPNFYTRYERLKEAISEGRTIPFTEFFRYTGKEWHAGNTSLNYTQSWGITYYALRGDNRAFRRAYHEMFAKLLEGIPMEDIIAEVFPEETLKEFEDAWKDYWRRN
jgi:tetratricopeptide (TPR) repeat protein